MKLFVSFSSRDGIYVRRILSRFLAQGIDVWDYSDEHQEIPVGEVLDRFIVEKIRASDAFLVLVTSNSFRSTWVQLEVEAALNRIDLQVLTAIQRGIGDADAWPKPLNKLTERKCWIGDLAAASEIEELVQAVCRRLNLVYRPLPISDPRLPFADRFESEIQVRLGNRPERQNATYNNLQRLLAEFLERFRLREFQVALSRINLFIDICEFEYPDERLYYPYIVAGVAYLSCGQRFRAAEYLESVAAHPAKDENYFGLLARIREDQGLFEEALRLFREASQISPDDAAIKSGILMNALQIGELAQVGKLVAEIDRWTTPTPEDALKVKALKAESLRALGRKHEAEVVYQKLLAEGLDELSVILNYSDLLRDSYGPERALRFLHLRSNWTQEEMYRHRIARWEYDAGNLVGSAIAFDELVKSFESNRRYRCEESIVLYQLTRRSAAIERMDSILRGEKLGLPTSNDDFYYDGMANWALGYEDRANYDFDRSKRSRVEHYRHTIGRKWR